MGKESPVVSKRYGARNEKDEQRRELEAAGWELIERGALPRLPRTAVVAERSKAG
jgi:hypothetical protein